MQRPTIIAVSAVGLLVLAALVILSIGPNVITMPTTPMAIEDARPISVVDMGKPSSLPVYDFQLPEFLGITKWWNTADGEPLTPAKLRGKVVLVDFWTYSCINCIRTYPFIKAMHERYADKGLVIVGVHTPEFPFEADPANVEREIVKNGFTHPIALDPDSKTWNAYHNRAWPAEYFFDRQGRLRRTHIGEGSYEESEEAIRSLLEEDGPALDEMGATPQNLPDFSKIVTQETYFGLERGREFMGIPGTEGKSQQYGHDKTNLEPDKWSIFGTWTFFPHYVEANSTDAWFLFNVQANKLHLVLESADGTDKHLEIFVDGKKTKDLNVNASTLYDVAEFSDAGRHTVEIRITEPGVRFYAATFS